MYLNFDIKVLKTASFLWIITISHEKYDPVEDSHFYGRKRPVMCSHVNVFDKNLLKLSKIICDGAHF